MDISEDTITQLALAAENDVSEGLRQVSHDLEKDHTRPAVDVFNELRVEYGMPPLGPPPPFA